MLSKPGNGTEGAKPCKSIRHRVLFGENKYKTLHKKMTVQPNCKKYLKNIVLTCCLVFLLASCATVKTKPAQFTYFQGNDSSYPAYIKTTVPEVTKIQKGDMLGIVVRTLNKESNEVLNFYNTNSLPQASGTPGASGGGNQPLGYNVDSLGNVSMPLVGKQQIEGLTLQQAEEKIRLAVEKTLKDPAVDIRFMNHKFTVLGEVGHVGTFGLLNDKTTIIEAITAAGDLSVYAKRDSIKIIRVVDGRRELGKVNLRSREVFTSPYFYVRNDDIIYVEPTKDKILPQAPFKTSLFVQRVPLYLGLVSSILSLSFLFTRL